MISDSFIRLEIGFISPSSKLLYPRSEGSSSGGHACVHLQGCVTSLVTLQIKEHSPLIMIFPDINFPFMTYWLWIKAVFQRVVEDVLCNFSPHAKKVCETSQTQKQSEMLLNEHISRPVCSPGSRFRHLHWVNLLKSATCLCSCQ